MSFKPVVLLDSVSKYFRPHKPSFFQDKGKAPMPFRALDKVSLEITEGSFVGLIGANGAGKSTLLKVISGGLKPSGGRVEVAGRVCPILDLGAGFDPLLTGRQNLFLVGSMRGYTRRQIQAKMQTIETFADIGQHIDDSVKTYSSGMAIRLAFALVIHLDPEILLVDEALAVGDEAFQSKCIHKLKELKAEGMTLVFVSHSSQLVLDLCDQAVLLDQGQLLASGSPNDIVHCYHKLTMSAPHLREKIKNDILNGREVGDNSNSQAVVDHASDDSLQIEQSHFDQALTNVEVKRYGKFAATIEYPRIIDEDGQQVNVLLARKRYIYSFNVVFTAHFPAVRFGMLIKTTTGVEIGGKETSDSFVEVQPGDKVLVSFRFQCNLTPGTYFMNAGALGVVEGEEVFLDRLVDAVQIKVLGNQYHQTGYVDFLVQSDVSVVASDNSVVNRDFSNVESTRR